MEEDARYSKMAVYNFSHVKQSEHDNAESNFQQKNRGRDDFGFHLYHFTKSGHLCATQHISSDSELDSERAEINAVLEPQKRFESIFLDRKLVHNPLPHKKVPIYAVCFSESSDASLEIHAENYSPWGLAFSKSYIFNYAKGNPVMYIRDDLLDLIELPVDVQLYTTPFRPFYNTVNGNKTLPVDYSHEREWRTPGPVEFEYENISFVCVPSWKSFKENLPRIYDFCVKNCIKIKEIKRDPSKCRNSYDCRYGESCTYGHTPNEEEFFRRKDPKSRKMGEIVAFFPSDAYGWITQDGMDENYSLKFYTTDVRTKGENALERVEFYPAGKGRAFDIDIIEIKASSTPLLKSFSRKSVNSDSWR